MLIRNPRLMFDDDPENPGGGQTLEEQLAAAKADVEKWKALSRKNEGRANENAEKAKKFDEVDEASKSEVQKAVERAERAERLLAERTQQDEAKTLRAEVAKAKGFGDRKIPDSALRGSTREELEAHADEILALIPAPPKAPSADGQGEGGDIGGGDLSVDDIVKQATS